MSERTSARHGKARTSGSGDGPIAPALAQAGGRSIIVDRLPRNAARLQACHDGSSVLFLAESVLALASAMAGDAGDRARLELVGSARR